MTLPIVDEVLSAWRSRDLVIVIVPAARQLAPGRERAYRLRIDHGALTGEALGDAKTARAWATALFAEPDHQQAARGLGELLVPPGTSDETLHVLGVGPLGKVPLPALRDADGSPSLFRRPLARVLALQSSTPAARGSSPPVVLADPQGNLPGAAREGTIAAQALGLRPDSGAGAAATRDRLFAARDAEVLHVAAHVASRGPGRALLLADGEINSADLLRDRIAPRLAILASCGSAAATDEEGWGSLAAAFLESGTAAVLATDRSINDDATISIIRDFYAQPDWRAEPARALARVQLALARRAPTPGVTATDLRTWAAFSILARPPSIPLAIVPPVGLIGSTR